MSWAEIFWLVAELVGGLVGFGLIAYVLWFAFTRQPDCYTCPGHLHQKATLTMAGYPVCRKCWERLTRKHNELEKFLDATTITEACILAYLEAHPELATGGTTGAASNEKV